MAITSLQMKIAAEKGVSTATQYIAPLKLFANSFRNQEEKKGSAVTVPVFTYSRDSLEFNKTTNNYGSGTTNATGVDIVLNKHYVFPVSYADTDFDECAVDFWAGNGEGIVQTLSEACVDEVIGKVTATSAGSKVQFTKNDAKAKATAANLFQIAVTGGLTPAKSVLVFSPTCYANLLGVLDASIYGGPEAIKTGMIPNLFGFKAVVCAKTLDTSINGFIADSSAIGVAARVPHVDASAYKEVGAMGDPNTGYAVQFRRFTDPGDGENKLAGTVIWGSAILNNNGIIALTETA